MTFIPKTAKIQQIAGSKQEVIEDLDNKFLENTILFIDWANVLGWQNQLEWHISAKRLKQFFASFSQVKKIYFYLFPKRNGYSISEAFISRNAKGRLGRDPLSYKLGSNGSHLLYSKGFSFAREL